MKDGLTISFTDPPDKSAGRDQNYGIEQWNTGGPKCTARRISKSATPREQGHDEVEITSAKLSSDAKTVRCSLKDVKPIMQMMIQMHIKAADGTP